MKAKCEYMLDYWKNRHRSDLIQQNVAYSNETNGENNQITENYKYGKLWVHFKVPMKKA